MDNETRQEFQKLTSRFDTHEQANEREFRGIETAFAEVQAAVASHVGNLRTEMVQRFDRVEQRLDRVDRRFDRVEDKLDRALASRTRPARRRGK